MTAPILSAAIFLLTLTAVQISSITIAIVRLRRTVSTQPLSTQQPPVSLVRPLCGIDNYAAETLQSTFELDYPYYEILFCVARADDTVLPLVKSLIAAHPGVAARLLVGDDRVSANPKLNNVVKGWRAASHAWIIIADSNVLMPRDYIQRLFASWGADTGLVASPPIGSQPRGFWAEVECAFLNTYQARWQYMVDSFGRGFAQGKTMLWRRAELERAGGIEALGSEVAEDAAATKIVRSAGLKVRLVDRPLAQPLGHRSANEVGIDNCAGHDYGAQVFSSISCPRVSQAAYCQRSALQSWRTLSAGRHRSAQSASPQSGTAARWCLLLRPAGAYRRFIRSMD